MELTQQVFLALAIAAFSGLLAWYVALRTGDVAGTKAAIEFEKEKANEARRTAFQSLGNEVIRIRKTVKSNSELKLSSSERGLIKMPVIAFETAFVSGKSGLSADIELLDAITDYLTEAHSLNSFIDYYHSLTMISERAVNQHRSNLLEAVVEESKKLPEILGRIETLLKRELER